MLAFGRAFIALLPLQRHPLPCRRLILLLTTFPAKPREAPRAAALSAFSALLTIKFVPKPQRISGGLFCVTNLLIRAIRVIRSLLPDLNQLSSVPFVKPLCPLWLALVVASLSCGYRFLTTTCPPPESHPV